MIIENCVAKGKTSLHYMQKVAEDFAARNIRTVKEAKTAMNQGSSLYYAVLKAFGIRGRNLVPEEQNFLKQWSDDPKHPRGQFCLCKLYSEEMA